jgi:two-component system, NarL family, sensor kinase
MPSRKRPAKVLKKKSSGTRNKVLRARVQELEDTLTAIRQGGVDALVISAPTGDQVFTLQGAEHPYRVLVETINEGAATLDAEGTVLYANARFAEFLNVPLEKFIGAPLQSHVPPSAHKELWGLIQESLSENIKGEISLETEEGRPRLIQFSLSAVKNSIPQTICVVATELTELAEANEALKANGEALRQLSSRLLQLQDEERRHIARDLHDITGQKLAFQSIVLSQLHNNATDPATKTSVAECQQLTNQVSEEIRTLSYLLHPPLLDELGLSSAVHWYTQGFEKRTGIHVEVDIARDFPRLPADVETTLFRVIQESLTNVHRYAESPTAFIHVSQVGSEVKLQIGDHGKGIHAEILKSSRNSVAPLGVGIQGMKERMRQLSGRLEVTSRPKQGTVVTATLPIREQRSESAASHAGPGEKPSQSNGDLQADTRPRTRILIADDHEVLRRGIRTMLEPETNWEICGEAIDGQEVIEKAIALSPDLIILDINMPVLNGVAAVRRIIRDCPKTRVLVFSVHESDQAIREILASGAHGYLSKAKGGEELVEVVKVLLSGKTFYPKKAAAN